MEIPDGAYGQGLDRGMIGADLQKGGPRLQGGSRGRAVPGSPLISIVTVVRNGVRELEQTIQSVLGQSYGAIEYLIIDGRSNDGTIDIIRSYEDRIDYWISEPDGGIYDAMNKGIAASSGALIGLLNAGDYLEPNAVERVVRTYQELGRPAIVYGIAYAVDVAHGVKAEMFPTLRYWAGMTINHQAMFVHRSVYDQIGPYDSSYGLAGDFDFLVRCMRQQVLFVSTDTCLVNYRSTGQSTVQARTHRREANRISKKYFPPLSLKRMDFLFFNYCWMPWKIGCRAFLYRVFGVKRSRRFIGFLKKILLGQQEHTVYLHDRGTNGR